MVIVLSGCNYLNAEFGMPIAEVRKIENEAEGCAIPSR